MRAIILSGVSAGLGKAFFELLLKTSAKIICIGRAFPAVHENEKEKVMFIKQDLTSATHFPDPNLWLSTDIKELIFINNAASITPISSIGMIEDSEIKDSIMINFVSPVLLSNKLVSVAKKRNIHFRIINISSGAATKAIAGWSLYCAGKAATKMFYDCLMLEHSDIEVKNIDPGVMDTNIQEQIRNASEDQFPLKKQFVELKKNAKLKSPSEVAQHILANEDLL